MELTVEKMPAQRSVPVALLAWREREVNLLTSMRGLPPADVEARSAREFEGSTGRLPILVADPFDHLRNKLAVNRPKDAPHIAILKRFICEEAVHAFENESDPCSHRAGREAAGRARNPCARRRARLPPDPSSQQRRRLPLPRPPCTRERPRESCGRGAGTFAR
jgi:hypothetical protein